MKSVTFDLILLTCPACRREVSAVCTAELKLQDGVVSALAEGNTVSAALNITGVRINHDCAPRIVRESSSPLVNPKAGSVR